MNPADTNPADTNPANNYTDCPMTQAETALLEAALVVCTRSSSPADWLTMHEAAKAVQKERTPQTPKYPTKPGLYRATFKGAPRIIRVNPYGEHHAYGTHGVLACARDEWGDYVYDRNKNGDFIRLFGEG